MDKGTDHQLMIDIETLGTEENSVVVSVAFMPFRLNGDASLMATEYAEGKTSYSDYFYRLDIAPQILRGREIDPDTLKWWQDQSSSAKEKSFEGHASNIKSALHIIKNNLSGLVGQAKLNTPDPPGIWANSPTFDLTILKSLFKDFGVEVPWNYYQERDVRTIVNLASTKTDSLIPHDPMADIYAQIIGVQKAYRKLNGIKI